MKVVLLQNIPKVGRKYETVDVAPGYARNYLLPRQLAEIATDRVLARLELARSLHEEQEKRRREALAKALNQIEGKTYTVAEKANEKGHLFAGLKAEDIASRLSEEAGLEIGANDVSIERPIKELGTYRLTVTVDDARAECTLEVVPSSEE